MKLPSWFFLDRVNALLWYLTMKSQNKTGGGWCLSPVFTLVSWGAHGEETGLSCEPVK